MAKPKKNTQTWAITYADMVTLLLTFFVLLMVILSEAEKQMDLLIQKLLDDIRSIFSPYDPKFKKLSIPEKEWEIIIQRLIEEYPGYIQAKIMEIISSFVSFNMPLLGISIDVLKLITDRAYLDELAKDIDEHCDFERAKVVSKDGGSEEHYSRTNKVAKNSLDYNKSQAATF